MQLERLRIRGFKSLYDVRCELGPFTLITGPNGAGKSNLVESIQFLSETYQYGLNIAVARAGGYDNIAHRRSRRAKAPISLEVVATLPARESARRFSEADQRDEALSIGDLRVRHAFSIRAETQALVADYRIEEENLEVFGQDDYRYLQLVRNSEGRVTVVRSRRIQQRAGALRRLFYPYSDASLSRAFTEVPVPRTTLALGQFPFSNVPSDFTRSIARTRVFQLSPQQLRRSGVPTPNASLDRYGENLPAVADYLRRNEGEAWQRIEGSMRAIMPALDEIDVAYTEERRLALQFREHGVGRPWNANEISDGTVQTLALFTALFDDRIPLLVIEEPENALHPWILRHFIDTGRAQHDKQLVLTTHSPVAIDYVKPTDLRLMWQRRGRSHFSSLAALDPGLLDLWKRGEIRSFELYDTGLVSEAIPEYFTQAEELAELEADADAATRQRAEELDGQ